MKHEPNRDNNVTVLLDFTIAIPDIKLMIVVDSDKVKIGKIVMLGLPSTSAYVCTKSCALRVR